MSKHTSTGSFFRKRITSWSHHLSAGLVLMTVLVLAAGCRNRNEPTTIEFWAMGREGEVVAGLISGFERENPGIRVKVQQMPWTAAHEKLLTAFAGESMPDLFQIGNTWVPEFVALNAIENLDARVTASKQVDRAHYFDGIWETNVMNGSLYSIPWYVDTRVIFYRSDLLRQAGYDRMPDTWSEWERALTAIKNRDDQERYGILLPTNEWAAPIILGLQKQSDFLKEDGRYGDFSGPRFREAFQFYIDLFRKKLAPPFSTTQVANLYQEFGNGYFAMYISGPWNIGEFKNRLPADQQDDWMTAPLPGPGDGQAGLSLAGGSSLAISRTSEHKEAVWKLVEYLSRPEQQVTFYKLTGDLPARVEAWSDPVLAGDPYSSAFFEQLKRVKPMPRVPEWERIVTRVYEYAEMAVRGQLSVDEALKRLDADVNRMLEKRRWILEQQERT